MTHIAETRGLRYRLQRAARRVVDQHRSINDCYRTVIEELAERSKGEVRETFERYRLALKAHFDLEEQVFFPAVHGADARQSAQIRDLVACHSRMSVELAHLSDTIESLPVDEFSRRLAGFATILESHERQEEGLLDQAIEVSSTHHESARHTQRNR